MTQRSCGAAAGRPGAAQGTELVRAPRTFAAALLPLLPAASREEGRAGDARTVPGQGRAVLSSYGWGRNLRKTS